MHYLKIAIFILATSLLMPAQASSLYPISSIKLNDEQTDSLDTNQGYLLIKLDIDGEGPSMHYHKFGSKSKKSTKVPFGNLDNGYHLLPLKKGTYQITQVSAPYYNLPFSLNVSAIPQWQFTIKAGHLNYIGQLSIEKERSTKHVNINLFNRFAQDYQEIQTAIAPLKEQYPLIVSLNYRDDFQQALAGTSIKEQSATQEAK